ncbi:hypothetical protein [Streptomyces sp. NPDC056670]|uniref:hypothetical protein n=1 Tax=Streptomyces sp. NPDC056670 TaxID=3345904 RepID=UPI0036D13BAC
MRSLLRIAVAAVTLLLLGMAVAPGAAHAVNGDERIAQMRLRVVDAVNEGTLGEIQRLRAAMRGDASDEVARLETKLRDGWQLAAELRSVRAAAVAHTRGVMRGAVPVGSAVGSHVGPAAAMSAGSAPGPAVASGVRSVDPSSGAAARDGHEDNVLEAARAALPGTPVGVLSLIGGGALALVGRGVAAAVVRRPYKKG